MDTVIYHNPKCSKSRATLALLRERGIEPEIVDYLENPPDALTLAEILRRLGLGPRELMRKREAVYRERNLADPGLDDRALIEAMIADPILIERPIVIHGGALEWDVRRSRFSRSSDAGSRASLAATAQRRARRSTRAGRRLPKWGV